MTIWLVLIVIGIVALIAAYTIGNMPPGIRQLLMFIGYAGVIIGVLLLVLGLTGVYSAAP